MIRLRADLLLGIMFGFVMFWCILGANWGTDLHGFCLKDEEEKTFRSLALNKKYPMRARTISGAITAYLDQFDSYEKIPAKQVEKRLIAFASARRQPHPVSKKTGARAQLACC